MNNSPVVYAANGTLKSTYLYFFFIFVALVRREERLPNSEIIRLSGVLGVDWDCLAGLLDIPYSQREEIRTNQMKYPDCTSKASKIFSLYNNREDPEFYILRKCFQELERQDLLNELPPVENQVYYSMLLFLTYAVARIHNGQFTC